MKSLLAVLSTLSLLVSAHALAWTYSETNGLVFGLATDSAGNVWAAGNIGSGVGAFALLELRSSDGALLYENELTGTGIANRVAIDKNNEPVAVGWTNVGPTLGDEFTVSRLTASGQVTFKRDGNQAGGWDEASGVAISPYNEAVAVGWLDGRTRLYVSVVDPSGSELRYANLSGGSSPNWAEAVSLFSNPDGDIAVAGTFWTSTWNDSFFVARIPNPHGTTGVLPAIDWQYVNGTNGTTGDIAHDVVVDPGVSVDAVIAVGERSGRMHAVRLDGNTGGVFSGWPYEVNSAAAYAVARDGSHNAIIAGMANGEMAVWKLAPDASVVWFRNDLSATCVQPKCDVAVDSNNDIVVAGTKGEEFYVQKITSANALAWSLQPFSGASPANAANAVTTSGTNVIAGGQDPSDDGFAVIQATSTGCF